MENVTLHHNVRNEIIEAARELFARYGFKKTTMDDIAKALDRAKSSIYYYFKNKDEIFQAVADIEINKGKEELRKVITMQEPAREKFAAYVTIRMSVIQSLSSYYNFIAEEYFENYRLIERLRVEIDKEELTIISEILRKGIKQKAFSIDNVNLTALNILNVLKGMEYSYLKEKDSRKLKKEIDNLATLFLQGLLKR